MTDQRTPAYAIAYLRDVNFGTEIIRYTREMDANLAPLDGHFVVHGGRKQPMEGQWDGDPLMAFIGNEFMVFGPLTCRSAVLEPE